MCVWSVALHSHFFLYCLIFGGGTEFGKHPLPVWFELHLVKYFVSRPYENMQAKVLPRTGRPGC